MLILTIRRSISNSGTGQITLPLPPHLPPHLPYSSTTPDLTNNPLGAALTCLALLQATRSIRAGNKAATNKWFRARIYAQGFTVAAMIAGSFYYKNERAEERAVEAVVAERKGEEKRAAWIKELEIRDREDREMAERAKKHAERRRAAMAAAAATKDLETKDKE
ncbi:hypothetical protein P167DRAFT_575426 [Morchella conica CCBAS932]|uniref:HIG1 domain-containing protein n=1 Tax=Morchella conica CCBAS932 TaxID=1392247 RepID=A0A3N4KLG5_9PEZI|nr:hypothetical protein P167DRAFT_575426 [Morchella conica CCBAS932]